MYIEAKINPRNIVIVVAIAAPFELYSGIRILLRIVSIKTRAKTKEKDIVGFPLADIIVDNTLKTAKKPRPNISILKGTPASIYEGEYKNETKEVDVELTINKIGTKRISIYLRELLIYLLVNSLLFLDVEEDIDGSRVSDKADKRKYGILAIVVTDV